MKVKEIVKKYLQDNGFEGLFTPNECGCELSDLYPCGSECVLDCEPGYKHPAQEGSEHAFMIYSKKPEEVKPEDRPKHSCYMFHHRSTCKWPRECKDCEHDEEPKEVSNAWFYIGTKPCGCIVAACVDREDFRKETATTIAEWVRDGYTVDHVNEPPKLQSCKCGKTEELFQEVSDG